MSPAEIKIELLKRGDGTSSLARRLGYKPQQVSHCIYRRRFYPELREKIARHLGKPVSEVFGAEPPPETCTRSESARMAAARRRRSPVSKERREKENQVLSQLLRLDVSEEVFLDPILYLIEQSQGAGK